MKDAVDMVRENRGIEIDLDKIDFEDQSVYSMIGEGKTVGVFQLESAGMTSFMKELKPDSLEDIIAGISLYRPGPMAEIPRYIQNKKNPNNIEYITPQLEHILDVTYGVMIYQEQVMQIVRDLAGYSLGRSDLVRRAMSKKKHSVMEQERKNFIYGIVNENGDIEVPGCIRNGITEEAGNKIFDQMMDFASYAFNKSHAAAYAVVGYQTAYLMRYYPVEFTAAMLNSVIGTSEKVAYYIRFAESNNIKVLLPDINESYSRFTVYGDTIRFGLAAVKNVGGNVVDSIVSCRKNKGDFKDLVDFCNKVDTTIVNKRALESLIKVGAFDRFGIYRSKLLAVYEKLLDSASNDRRKNIEGQISLFGDEFSDVINQPRIEYPNIREFNKKNMLAIEKEMTGLYLSGHPLDEYKKSLKTQTSIEIQKINEAGEALDTDIDSAVIKSEDTVYDGMKVVIGGIISSVNRKVTRNNDIMAFMTLEDLTGSIEVIVFPKTLRRVNSFVNEDELVVVRGRVSIREDEGPKILCEDINVLEKVDSSKVYIRLEDKEKLMSIKEPLKILISKYKGETPLYIFTNKEKQQYRMSREMWIDKDSDIISILEQKFGKENIKIVDENN